VGVAGITGSGTEREGMPLQGGDARDVEEAVLPHLVGQRSVSGVVGQTNGVGERDGAEGVGSDVADGDFVAEAAGEAHTVVDGPQHQSPQQVVPGHDRVPQHHQKQDYRDVVSPVEEFVVGSPHDLLGQQTDENRDKDESDRSNLYRKIISMEYCWYYRNDKKYMKKVIMIIIA